VRWTAAHRVVDDNGVRFSHKMAYFAKLERGA
jgi:hypothetical protein